MQLRLLHGPSAARGTFLFCDYRTSSDPLQLNAIVCCEQTSGYWRFERTATHNQNSYNIGTRNSAKRFCFIHVRLNFMVYFTTRTHTK